MNINIDKYLVNGCMRCKYGGTPKCKVLNWVEELVALRAVVMETGLKEEIKWGVPVYTHHGKNIITINALKESANIGFFKGALLTDKHKILQQQGNIQSARIIKFSNVNDIIKIKETLKLYVLEAIAIEESGKKVLLKKNPEPIPEELLDAFEQEPSFKKAFYKLTPGRQRAYIIYFSQAKQIQTRIKRIENYKTQIFEGKGMNDHYTSKR
jgi:uncharacterized protein YdeI (YjbR/CyaY-like superfamily)